MRCAPDAGHLFIGTNGTATKATLVAGDKMNLATINKLRTKSRRCSAASPTRPSR